MPTPPTPARKPLRIIDLVAGIVIAIIGALIGFIMLGLVGQFGGLAAACEGVSPDGLRCNAGYLSGSVILGTAIVVFGWFLTTGFFIVRILRRQLAFWLPLVGIVVMVAAFYVIAIMVQPYMPL
jgi:hypothetical protein